MWHCSKFGEDSPVSNKHDKVTAGRTLRATTPINFYRRVHLEF
jgi:hypothetical protein